MKIFKDYIVNQTWVRDIVDRYGFNISYENDILYLFNRYIALGISGHNNSFEAILFDLTNLTYIPFLGRLMNHIVSKSNWIELKAEAEKLVPENVESKKAIVESYIHLIALDKYASDLLEGNCEKYKSLFDVAPQFHKNEIKRITKHKKTID